MKIQQKDIYRNPVSTLHDKYMLRCIQLAKNGLGITAPNPMVGSVIVHKGKILGEGFTSPYGGPHAEVNAIASVKDKLLLKEATLYVTLEPCSHFGKTPPCADLILEHQIPNVVVGLLDPHKKVAGKGLQKLMDGGCEVLTGVLEQECREHHKRFLTFHEKKRPYIILKWAQSQDGFIAPNQSVRNKTPEPFWITGPYSRQRVHQWRSQEQAILVGTNTVLEDNPKLDVRHWKGNPPLRVVLDRTLKIQGDFHVLDGSIPTLILTEANAPLDEQDNIRYEHVDFSENVAKQICTILHNYMILSVIVEGGTQTLETFINSKLWDEARVFTGDQRFQEGVAAPKHKGRKIREERLISDTLDTYYND